MIDSLLKHREQAANGEALTKLGLRSREYVLVTAHRPSNVTRRATLSAFLDMLDKLSREVAVVFPVHPRTRAQIETFGLAKNRHPNLQLIPPLGYLDFLQCLDNARFVVTDSGGIQEETTLLGVPCITARDNTERPVTCELGTNVLAGSGPSAVWSAIEKMLAGDVKRGERPPKWDGKAGDRIVGILRERLLAA